MIMFFLVLCFLLPLLARSSNNEMNPIVTIKQGQLRGVTGRNIDGKQFYQFFGIPYAKPPLRELRFKPPQPGDSWTGVRDGSKIGDTCISIDSFTVDTVGSEDCLYLNVYTRNLPNKNAPLKPVMVFIYGGGLTAGTSNPKVYGPEFLMLKDIVLVTFNYRLGVLGFLSFDDPTLEVPGNMGLKDQNLALKWVRDNIKSFNGNPNDVTIFGHSAGSSSVHAHILSTASKGLFHKAILQSGTVLNTWFWGSKNNAIEIVNKAGKEANSQKEALNILKNMSATDIFAAQELIIDATYPANQRPLSAVLEIPNDTAFLTKNPVETIKSGRYNHVPMMMGYTKDEGMLLDIEYIAENKTSLHIPQLDLKQYIPFTINVPIGSGDYEDILAKLKKLYDANPTIDSRYDLITDSYILVALVEALRLHAKSSSSSYDPIFLYRMSLSGELNQFKCLLNITNEPGVAHSDELGYLFKTEITPPILQGGPEDKSLRTFVDIWTNFAIHGNPTSRRGPHVTLTPTGREDDLKVIDIGRSVCMKNIPERNRLKVWREILKKWPMVNFT